MKFRHLLTWLSLLAFSFFVAVSCTPGESLNSLSTVSPASVTAPLRLGFSAWPGYFPWQIAREEKLFEANNIKVDLRWFYSFLDSIKAREKDELDANCETVPDAIVSLASGSDLAIILITDSSTGNDQIIARQGINSLKDLKGKKVATEIGSVDHYFLLLALKKAGMKPKDIKLQNLELSVAAAAFADGQLDAVAVFAPFTTDALKRPGSKVLLTSKDFPGAIAETLIVNRQAIEERPQDIQALINTWFATLDFMRKNPQKSYEIMAKRAGVTVEEYKKYDAGTTLFTLEDNLRAFSPGQDMTSLYYATPEISKILQEAGIIKKPPELSRLFDDRFVKAYAESLKNN